MGHCRLNSTLGSYSIPGINFYPNKSSKTPGQYTRDYVFFSQHEKKKCLKLITSKTSNHKFVSGGPNYYTALRI